MTTLLVFLALLGEPQPQKQVSVVVATMNGCAPCARMKKNAAAYAKSGSPLRFVDDEKQLTAWKITSVPTILYVVDGKIVARQVGFASPEAVAGKCRELRR